MLLNRDGYDACGRRRCFLDLGSDPAPAPAPDYTPVAQSSEAAARIGAEQADRVLAESKRQYERNMEVAQPIIDQQSAMMKQSVDQGNEYYDYWKTKAQPVENALNTEAMAAGSLQKQNEAADRAVADSQGGYTKAINTQLRQAKRYGINPSATGGMVIQQAQNTAAAATGARDKEIAMSTAKKLDVAGLYRGMPGASQGAYSVANQSGNSAVGNSTAVGNGMVAGTQAAGNLTMGGQQLRLQGLGNVLGAQSSNYNAAQQQNNQGFGSLLGGIGGLASGAGALYTAFSSEDLKEDKQPIDGALASLRKLPVEAWSYKDGVADEGEHIGPYAEDVEEEFGDQAAPGGKMLDLVSMNGLLLKGLQELADKVDTLGKNKSTDRGVMLSLRKSPVARHGMVGV